MFGGVVIFIFSLVKCHSCLLAIFNWVVFLLLSLENSLSSPATNHLSYIWLAYTVYKSVTFLLILLRQTSLIAILIGCCLSPMEGDTKKDYDQNVSSNSLRGVDISDFEWFLREISTAITQGTQISSVSKDLAS